MADYVRLVGPFHGNGGYSHATRAALSSLLLAGYEVQAIESDKRIRYVARKLRDDQPWDGSVEVSSVIPPLDFQLPEYQINELEKALEVEVPSEAPTIFIQLPGVLNGYQQYCKGPRIGWTMFEADTLPSRWTSPCYGVDSIWVPSLWCVQLFQKFLKYGDVRLVPMPVDERTFFPHGPTLSHLKKDIEVLFFSVFATTERKRWRLLMQAFTEEFSGMPVRLLVKPGRITEVAELAAWCREAGADVQVDTQERSDWDMACMYRTADCFVLPSCEGFGLPFVEAGLCGTPSIALANGGAKDVVTPETGWRLPSSLEPIIGHMPHLHPSTTKFWSTSIGTLRSYLRRAYREREDFVNKGANAYEHAQSFTCGALAERIHNQLERVCNNRKSYLIDKDFNEAEIKCKSDEVWFTSFGAWGDTLAALGIAEKKADQFPGKHIGMIYYGHDKNIVYFIKEQGWFDEVRWIKPESKETYWEHSKFAIQSRHNFDVLWLEPILNKHGIDIKNIVPTHVCQVEDTPICRWHNAKLSSDVMDWCKDFLSKNGPFILLHPISTQSVMIRDHWPEWKDGIQWLLEETPYTYVLTGTECIEIPKHKRLINLLNCTPSMQYVFGLCEVSSGVISTCNAVSLWSVIQNIPAIICSNHVFNNEHDYFKQWVTADNILMLLQTDTLRWFQKQAASWLLDRFPGEQWDIRRNEFYEERQKELFNPALKGSIS